mmetsp:Transcript_9746/g.25567  ORF Transcript_9746/g.25567 Transcript_9746/m.25567 type:complete len:281 (-) Transcript_9746:1-843(-)
MWWQKKQQQLSEEKFLQVVRMGSFFETVEMVSDSKELLVAVDPSRRNALMFAAASGVAGSAEKLAFLIDARLNVEARDAHGWTALMHGCGASNFPAVALLLEARACGRVRAPDGRTPIIIAARETSERVVHHLVRCKAHVDDKDNNDWSGFFYAVERKSLSMTNAFPALDASTNIASTTGLTPLLVAARLGFLCIARRLVAKFANLNAQHDDGNTPLMLALAANSVECADFFLDKGADVHLENENGETAADIAEEHNLPFFKDRILLIADACVKRSSQRS